MFSISVVIIFCCFSAEIVDFCDFLSPTREEQTLRNEAVESVFGVIKYIWPSSKVQFSGFDTIVGLFRECDTVCITVTLSAA